MQRPGTLLAHTVTPGSLDEALDWLQRPNTRPVAGGTDLMVELDRGEHRELETLVDLTRIPGLDRIEQHDGTVTLGPSVTHNQVVAHDSLADLARPLVQASWEVGSPQLRNRATVAGNIVTASPANDTLSALVALDAEVTLQSTGGTRTMPLTDFHLGVRSTALEPGELLTAITFPALTEHDRSLYLKLGLRRAQAISVVHLAIVCRMDGPGPEASVTGARLALGSVAPTIVRAAAAESMIIGSGLDPATIDAAATAAVEAVNPIDDLRATARYRNDLLAEMVTRALHAVADGASVVPERPPLLWGRSPGTWPTGAQYGAEHRVGDAVTATVNGSAVSGRANGSHLLNWLRDQGASGVKEGCAEGECGSCTVELDGQAVLSCLVPATRAEGAEVRTIEGLAPATEPGGRLHPLQQAFIDTGAVQCGFCIPGFLMSGAKLLEEFPAPTEAQIKAGLSGNLCRCTGYYKIEDAVRVALNGSDEGDRS